MLSSQQLIAVEDIVASRSGEILVIELKSTLRPEAPWEVYKRNQDILKGLGQAQALVRRGIGNRGLVITDGYRGDYKTADIFPKLGAEG